ncbi:MAG TPA: amino acid racemase [Rhizomicrobium sp.]|nr:amino acid racemase [Rhizomicrobium sp.]
MKRIGILAHSAEGAALCFLEACHAGEARLGAHNHPAITLDIVAMGEAMDLWERNDFAGVREILARSCERLARAGADFFVCPDNTAHLALELDGAPLALPGLNIAGIVAETARSRGFGRVGLLGTKWTMNGATYANAFARAGLDCRVPPEGQRADMNAIIFDELVRGKFLDTSRARVVAMIEGLKREGCDCVALSCTEIPLLVSQDVSPLPILDSTRLLARAAVAVALGEKPMPVWRGGSA